MPPVAYFDTGTTNSRAYILESGRILGSARRSTGGRDSSARGGGAWLEALWSIYGQALGQCGLSDGEIEAVYVSGVATAPFGIHEVPHLPLPASGRDIARGIRPFLEDVYFHRDLLLIPGLVQMAEGIAEVNNLRGEETELLGVMEALGGAYAGECCAVVLPGSHTQTAFVRDGVILGISSCVSGELYRAAAEDTVLSPVLKNTLEAVDGEFVRRGAQASAAWGINRALYICHNMRVFGRYTPLQRRCFGEGALLGGVAQALDLCCARSFPECRTALVAAEQPLGGLYRALLEGYPRFSEIRVFPPESVPWSARGLMALRALHEIQER